jgi:hypothetical protein
MDGRVGADRDEGMGLLVAVGVDWGERMGRIK